MKMTFHICTEFDGSLKRATESPQSEINGLKLELDMKPAVAYENTWLIRRREGYRCRSLGYGFI